MKCMECENDAIITMECNLYESSYLCLKCFIEWLNSKNVIKRLFPIDKIRETMKTHDEVIDFWLKYHDSYPDDFKLPVKHIKIILMKIKKRECE